MEIVRTPGPILSPVALESIEKRKRYTGEREVCARSMDLLCLLLQTSGDRSFVDTISASPEAHCSNLKYPPKANRYSR